MARAQETIQMAEMRGAARTLLESDAGRSGVGLGHR